MEKVKTVTDFTQGKVKNIILKFYFPLLATSMLQQFYSFADTAIVGRGSWGQFSCRGRQHDME